MKFSTVIEGLRFLWCLRGASRHYFFWRLGTVYGGYKDGKPRSLPDLLGQLWRDRKNVVRFLEWRRQTRGFQ